MKNCSLDAHKLYFRCFLLFIGFAKFYCQDFTSTRSDNIKTFWDYIALPGLPEKQETTSNLLKDNNWLSIVQEKLDPAFKDRSPNSLDNEANRAASVLLHKNENILQSPVENSGNRYSNFNSLVVPEMSNIHMERDKKNKFSNTRGKINGIHCCGYVEDWCRICPNGVSSDVVTHRFLNDYAYVPRALVNLTQQDHQKNLCDDNLSVNLFKANTKSLEMVELDGRINEIIGLCPSMLVTTDIDTPGNKFPSKVIEMKCMCSSNRCSGQDFRCIEVKQDIDIWHKLKNGNFSSTTHKVTVGCLCAQKIGYAANMIDNPYQDFKYL